jgi:hypothetical protein
MRDGTTLQANITRPNADGQFPVLPERTPYDNEAGSENVVGSPEYYASRGLRRGHPGYEGPVRIRGRFLRIPQRRSGDQP